MFLAPDPTIAERSLSQFLRLIGLQQPPGIDFVEIDLPSNLPKSIFLRPDFSCQQNPEEQRHKVTPTLSQCSPDADLFLAFFALNLSVRDGDPYENRTRVASVKGMCPNR
jgi:hypothetical protein